MQVIMLGPVLNHWIRDVYRDFAGHYDVEFVSVFTISYNIFAFVIDLVFKDSRNFFDNLRIALEKLDLLHDFNQSLVFLKGSLSVRFQNYLLEVFLVLLFDYCFILFLSAQALQQFLFCLLRKGIINLNFLLNLYFGFLLHQFLFNGFSFASSFVELPVLDTFKHLLIEIIISRFLGNFLNLFFKHLLHSKVNLVFDLTSHLLL